MNTKTKRTTFAMQLMIAMMAIALSMPETLAQTVKHSGTSTGYFTYINNKSTCATTDTKSSTTVTAAGSITSKKAAISARETTVSWQITDDGKLTISKGDPITVCRKDEKENLKVETIYPMPNYTDSDMPEWYEFASEITSVEMDDDITSVGHRALYKDFTNVKTVHLPASIEYIGNYALRNCTSLISTEASPLVIPEGLCATGSAVFYGDKVIEYIKWPAKAKNIASSTFHSCTKLTKVIIPEGVEALGKTGASSGESYPFQGCTSLASITLPSTLKTIGDRAFNGCTALTSITIPAGVENIGINPFSGCNKLAKITLGSTDHFETNDDGTVLYDKGKTTLITYLKSKKDKTFDLPSSVKTIGTRAFFENINIETVTVSEGLANIQTLAFYGCTNFKSIDLPKTLSVLEDGAFTKCNNLAVTIDSENQNFSLEGVIIFQKLTDSRKLVSYPTTITDPVYTIPADVSAIGARAFQNVTALTTIKFAEGSIINSIGEYAFYQCSNLENITLPNSITTIGRDALRECKKLTSVTLPNNSDYKTIATELFYNCTALEEINIPSSITTFSYGCFAGTNISQVDIPNGVTTLAAIMFQNCKRLETVVLPENVKSTNYKTFAGCTGLKEIVIGSQFLSFGYEAFSGCDALEVITMKNMTPPSITPDIFEKTNPATAANMTMMVHCEAKDAYLAKEYYSKFFDVETIEKAVLYDLKVRVNDETMGEATVSREATCGNEDANAIVRATPYKGNKLTEWSDGKTSICEGEGEFGVEMQLKPLTSDVTWTAYFEKINYVITDGTTDENGTIQINDIDAKNNSVTANYEDEVTISEEPNLGYELGNVVVEDRSGNKTTISASPWVFEMPAEDVTVTAIFKKTDYAINVSNDIENGTVVAPSTANYRNKVELTITPAFDYKLSALSVKNDNTGVEIKVENNMFTMPASTVSISAEFVAIDHRVAVGETFTVGDLKYKVLTLEPNTVSVGAKNDDLTGDITIGNSVTYDGIAYSVVAITSEGFAYADNINSITINRTEPIEIKGDAGDAFSQYVTIKVPCGSKGTYVEAGYPEVQISSISDYEYAVSVTADSNGKAVVVYNASCDDHSAKVEAIANAGYTFSKWDNGATANPYVVSDVESNISLKATFSAIEYDITKTVVGNGTVELSANSGIIGNTVSITATAGEGYKVSSIVVKDENDNTISVAAGNMFTMPASDVEVTVTFTAIDYKINFATMSNGSVSVEKNTANAGEVVAMTVSASKGYELDALTVKKTIDNTAVAIIDNSFTMPTSDVNVSATFKKTVYDITVEAATNGSVNVAKSSAVMDEDITITATPIDAHYSVASISVTDAEGKEIASSLAFKMPASNVTISVTFEKSKTFVVGDEFTIGKLKYRITSLEPNTVEVSAANSETSDNITLSNGVTYLNTTFSVTGIAENGFATNNITSVVSMLNTPLTLGANAFKVGEEMMLSVPCNTTTSYAESGYDEYFEINEIYEGGLVSVMSADINMGKAEVTRQQDCIANALIKATPQIGYRFVKWSDDNEDSERQLPRFDDNIALTASFEIVDYMISTTIASNTESLITGEVEVAKTANYNDEIVISYTPATGYKLGHIEVKDINDVALDVVENHFTMPGQNVTIEVTFEAIDYAISVAETEGGHIETSSTVGHIKDRISVNAIASTGYTIDEALTVTDEDGGELTVSNGAFTMPAKNVNVTATFKKVDYKIIIAESEDGYVTVENETAQYGDEVVITSHPSEGFKLESIELSNTSVAVSEDGHFVMPAGNVTIYATFVEDNSEEGGEDDEPTGISKAQVDRDYEAYGVNGAIVVKITENNSKVSIYSVNGAIIWSKECKAGEYRVAVEPGVYVVKVGKDGKTVVSY